MQHWTALIRKAEESNPLSPREGKLLKRIPLESRLTENDLIANLTLAIASRLQADSPSLLVDMWSQGQALHYVFLTCCSLSCLLLGNKAYMLHLSETTDALKPSKEHIETASDSRQGILEAGHRPDEELRLSASQAMGVCLGGCKSCGSLQRKTTWVHRKLAKSSSCNFKCHRGRAGLFPPPANTFSATSSSA